MPQATWISNSTGVRYAVPVQSVSVQRRSDTSTATWETWSSTSSTTSTITWTTWTTTTSTEPSANAVISWYDWNTYQQVVATGIDLEAAAELLRQQAAQREAQRIRDEKIQKARQVATAKAEELLRQHLSEDQVKELDEAGRFTVVAPSGNRYCILRGFQGNVRGDRFRYCCHGPSNIPVPDQMLMQKLALETDEEAFLAVANRSDQ